MRLLALALLLVAAPVAAQSGAGGPASHRLLLAPTARPVPVGQTRLGLTELAVPTAAVGVGHGASVAAGVVAFPHRDVAGLLFVEPKVTLVDRPGFALALGATGRVDLFRDGESTAVPYAVVTAGDRRVAWTVGLGARLDVERPPYPVYNLHDDALGTPPLLDGMVLASRPARRAHLVAAPAGFVGLEAQASRRLTLLVEAALMPDQDVRIAGGGCVTCSADGSPSAFAYELGPLHHDLTLGAAARIEAGRAAYDLGLVVVRDADGYARAVTGLAPWLSVAVGLGE